MRSVEYYKKKQEKKIKQAFIKILKKQYKGAHKNGKVLKFTAEDILYLFIAEYPDLWHNKPSAIAISYMLIAALNELSSKYTITTYKDIDYYTMEQKRGSNYEIKG